MPPWRPAGPISPGQQRNPQFIKPVVKWIAFAGQGPRPYWVYRVAQADSSSRHGQFRFSVCASGLIVIDFADGPLAPSNGAKTSGRGKEITTMTTSSGNVSLMAEPAQDRRNCAHHPHHRPIRPAPGPAARLGGFQGGAQPRHHSLPDLSGDRTGAGAHRAGLFGIAVAVSTGGGFCPDRSVRSSWSL